MALGQPDLLSSLSPYELQCLLSALAQHQPLDRVLDDQRILNHIAHAPCWECQHLAKHNPELRSPALAQLQARQGMVCCRADHWIIQESLMRVRHSQHKLYGCAKMHLKTSREIQKPYEPDQGANCMLRIGLQAVRMQPVSNCKEVV